jgi:hypothetical protein
MTPTEYQSEFDANTKAGRQLVYLNAYQHSGGVRFTGIWHQKAASSSVARHGLTSQQFQAEFDSKLASGYLTRVVTGYASGDSHRFGACWAK